VALATAKSENSIMARIKIEGILERRLDRDDADQRLPIFLRLPSLRRGAEAAPGRLLRLLLLRRRALPAGPASPRDRRERPLLPWTVSFDSVTP
jgi:hypothetical protein